MKQTLEIAYEVRAEVLKADSSACSILRKCYTICQMLSREVDWIKLELFGYSDKYKTIGELLECVPEYRRVRLLYHDVFGKPILINPKLSSIADFALDESICEIESSKGSLYIMGDLIDHLREEFKVPVYSAEVSDLQLRKMIEAVKNRALEFINKIILELEYGDTLTSIFEETKKFVDSKLIEINRSAVEKLTKTYKDIVQGSSPLTWSQAAFACRDILQDFTDSIYKSDYLPNGQKPPTRAETKKKLAFTLRARLSASKDAERELLESMIDFLLNYFGKISNLIQKHTHPAGFEVKREDAHRCIIYTYLIIGDVLKILEEHK